MKEYLRTTRAPFNDHFYAACELVERYVLGLAIDVAIALEIDEPLRGVGLTAAGLAEARRFDPSFLPALRWLLTRLRDADLLIEDTAGGQRTYRLNRALERRSLEPLRAALLANDPHHAPTIDLLDAAAATYPKVAHGEARGADALFGLGQVALWCAYFDNANPIYAVNNRVAALSAARRLSGIAAPRILELGAGAGSGTEALLDEAAERGVAPSSYRATEPSQFFRRRAERSLRTRHAGANLTFAGLDIDRPWAEQGIAPGSLDLVFGVNVLHVARDLQFSLSEARTALAPGGFLILGEALRPGSDKAIWAEFVFQLLDGFTEVNLDRSCARHTLRNRRRGQCCATRASPTSRPSPTAEIHKLYPAFCTGASVLERPKEACHVQGGNQYRIS